MMFRWWLIFTNGLNNLASHLPMTVTQSAFSLVAASTIPCLVDWGIMWTMGITIFSTPGRAFWGYEYDIWMSHFGEPCVQFKVLRNTFILLLCKIQVRVMYVCMSITKRLQNYWIDRSEWPLHFTLSRMVLRKKGAILDPFKFKHNM